MAESRQAVAIAHEVTGMPLESAQASLIGAEHGVFSTVYRVEAGSKSVVVKLPRSGPNGDAARATGAYEREQIAYEHLLVDGLRVPTCFGVVPTEEGPAFVLEDLTSFEAVDQIKGLAPTEAMAIVDPLYECHAAISVDLARSLNVRSVTPRGFLPDALERGVDLVPNREVFARLLASRPERIDAFAQLPDPVVCHGDPRADNLVIGPVVKLFDWQQIAIQAGEADLAWLAATSLEPRVRRSCEGDLVARYALRMNRSFDEAWDRYQKSMIVPGLAVLMLAQRRTEGRLQRLVDVSVERITSAVIDHFP